MDEIERLERLSRLRADGAISDEEYESQKRLILDRPVPESSNKPILVAVLVALVLLIGLVVFLLSRSEKKEAEPEFVASGNHASAMEKTDPAPSNVVAARPPQPEADRRAEAIRWATSQAVIGTNPAFLEQRLGVPREKSRHSLVYDLNGCTIDYNLEGTSVKSYYARLGANCRLNIDGRVISRQTTLGSVFRQGSRWRAHCLALCGNAADPTVEVVEGGGRAQLGITISFASDDYQPMRAWAEAVERREGVSPFDATGDPNPYYGATNPPSEVLPALRRARVSVVMVGR